MSKPKAAKKVIDKAEEAKTDVDFGFIVVKIDGSYRVTPLTDEEGKPLFESDTQEIYAACDAVCRNIQSQTIAATIQGAMMAVAQQAQLAQESNDGTKRTEGGLVIPK